jgi:hypothetical protein
MTQGSGFSLISQQMTFEIDALKSARFNAAEAARTGNLELLEMAVSALFDLAALEQIQMPRGRPASFGNRMDRFRSNLSYFQHSANHLSAELGKKWAMIRSKYATPALGLGSTRQPGDGAPVQPFKKPKWAQAQDDTEAAFQ